MEPTDKVREDRVRRMLYRQGYALSKSARRDPRAWDFGAYLITHILAGYDSGVIAGYCNSLEEAEKWALEGDQAAELEDASGRPEEDWEEIGTITVGANWVAQLGGAAGDGPHPVKVLRHKDRNIRFIKLDPQAEKWVKVGEVAIDTGRLLLSDPAYVGDLPQDFLNTDPDGSGATGLRQMAMLVTAGPGDGGYPVSVNYAASGEVAAVRVDFLPR